MTNNVPDHNSKRFPGTYKEVAIFWRKASTHDPNAWKMLGRPTTEHDTLRNMMMPEIHLDSSIYGKGWLDPLTDVEYKIMECTVTRTEWRTETNK